VALGCVILAAGEGKRMKSALAKPLHRVCGRTMLDHVLAYVAPLQPETTAVVLGVGREMMEQALAGCDVRLAIQEQQLGTGHAVLAAADAFAGFDGDLVVTCADIPLVRSETLQALLDEHRARGAAATVMTAIYDDPTGYGRVVRDERGLLRAIVEHRDASDDVRALREINAGIYCFQARPLFEALARLRNDNDQGEYYLPDVLTAFVAAGETVAAVIAADADEVMGINDRVQLAQAEAVARQRVREALMRGGVTMIDPAATYVDVGVEIGPDTVIWPGAVLTGATTIGAGCTIGPHVQLNDITLGDGCEVRQGSGLTGSTIGERVTIGPFAFIRSDCRIEDQARVGAHTEMVRSVIGRHAKMSHFSYAGDSEIGAGTNIGAGVVTCNYDGQSKHRTTIGAGAFIGSDAILVAPVNVAPGAYVAAGSVITKDVPTGALGIGRAKQDNLEGWVERKRRQEAGEGHGPT
jgi:bifunctional UDP-N-acetylglucosamine pyrophosphorylase / glucosamine-1-phosphate N-acetyltransferase